MDSIVKYTSIGSFDDVTMSKETIPDGDAGTEKTINRMIALIGKGKLNQDIIYAARQIAMQAPERDQLGQIEAIHNYIKKHVYYINDPDKYEAVNGKIKNKNGIEVLADPVWMLNQIKQHGKVSGDCDEFVVLEGSLLGAIGFPVYIQAIGMLEHNGRYGHVYMYTYTSKGQRVPLDAIIKSTPFEWEVPENLVKKNSLNN